MASIKISANGDIQAAKNNQTITVSNKSGATISWPGISLYLCDQNDATLPSTPPASLPTGATYLKGYVENLTVTNGAFSHTFSNVQNGTYKIVAIKVDNGAKVVTQTDHINDLSVP
jgi:hypothetical protein